jgi:hypothetical protein
LERIKNKIIAIVFGVILVGGFLFCVLKPTGAFSESERRELALFPEFTASSLFDGSFAKDFEVYATERFPYRDTFRALKAWFASNVMMKRDNNGVFVAEGHISKIDSVENEGMMDYAAKKFRFLYDSYLSEKDIDVYFSIIPDKNFCLAKKNGYPSLDYESFIQKMREKTPYMQYIDVTNFLSSDDYYRTDTHWRQEKIIDIAEHIAYSMGTDIKADGYKRNVLEKPFYGVYSGQLAMKFEPDELVYLTNDTIDNCIVTYYDTGKPETGEMYNMKKAYGKDPYEMFLSGTTPFVTIENPKADTQKELVVFRDSFGSSLVPLMAEGYKKITVIDIRYIQSSFVGALAEFNENCDVLFVYSTALLNNSMAMK